MGFFDVVNIYGLLCIIILAAPNIVYARTHNYDLSVIGNRSMLYIERVGKYCSMFLMAINLGILEEGFTAPIMKTFWIFATLALTALYTALWIFFFKRESKAVAYSLTVIAAVIFMLSGLLQVKTLLLTFGIVYLIGGLYVTSKFMSNR
ncbi:MAG: hypothetical protein LUF33_02780 [Clostridiales bacterium]|nr:hypothetical protein [Clostridiales bacterium]